MRPEGTAKQPRPRTPQWGFLLPLCILGLTGLLAAEEAFRVKNVEYLQGATELREFTKAALVIDSSGVVFLRDKKRLWSIDRVEVVHVAAQARATMRARTTNTGLAAVIVVGSVIPILAPAVLLFHRAEKHLLSIEYRQTETGEEGLILFNIRDHSARAVKKMIDDKLGLTPEYYRQQAAKEERRKAELESRTRPVGHWRTDANTVVGNNRSDRILVAAGHYAVLLFNRYIGLVPEGAELANYRVSVREVKDSNDSSSDLSPILKGSRVVGFRYAGKRYLVY